MISILNYKILIFFHSKNYEMMQYNFWHIDIGFLKITWILSASSASFNIYNMSFLRCHFVEVRVPDKEVIIIFEEVLLDVNNLANITVYKYLNTGISSSTVSNLSSRLIHVIFYY